MHMKKVWLNQRIVNNFDQHVIFLMLNTLASQYSLKPHLIQLHNTPWMDLMSNVCNAVKFGEEIH